MTHYRMQDRVPSAVITSNHNELKLYQGNVVYLNDGDNFELRFFNPLQEKIGVEIIFNGIRKGDGYLVLNPGQDLTLDRFLNEQRKMLFETYKIDGNNKESVEAIEKNGLITFNFYKEEYYYNYNTLKYFSNVNCNNRIYNYDYNNIYDTNVYNTNITSDINNVNTTNNKNIKYNSTCNEYSEYMAENIDISNVRSKFLSKSIETGRIEKGEKSNQDLKNVNVNFSYSSFHSLTYKIMPTSTMNRESTEIRQYCSECGYRLRKSTWKYCPSCGQKIS